LPDGIGSVGRITHSPLSSAVPVPITWPLLVTVTSLPEAARPAITSEPCGSTRTTSNDGAGAEGSVAGSESIGVSGKGGTAACCVVVGAAAVAGAEAALLETEADVLGAADVAAADPMLGGAVVLAGAEVDPVAA